MSVKNKTIISIFLNFLFVVGVILTVVGFINGLQFTAKTIIFDKYPLQSYEEDCQRYTIEARPVLDKIASPAASLDEQIAECKVSVEQRRKIKMVEDLTQSVGFLVSGLVLAFLFNPKSGFAATFSQ